MPIPLPNTTITILPAQTAISNNAQKVLFVGQMKTGTATAGALTANIGNSGEEDALFGKTSMLAQMVRSARLINKTTQFDAIALADNAGGTAATGTIVFTGTATATGTVNISIGSGYNYTLPISIVSGDTATAVGDKLAAAVTALTNAPFTAANVTGTVTVTCVHKGVVGNKIGYKVTGAVAGISIALTLPTNGATNPVLTNLFNVIEGERYQTIVWPESYTLSTVTTMLDARFNINSVVLDGVAVQTITDTYANIITAGNAQNTPSLCLIANKLLAVTAQVGGALPEFSDVISSQFAAVRALRLTSGADISQYVIATSGANDAFGGPAIASLPYFNTPFPYLALIDRGVDFTNTEITALNNAGVSTIGNNITRTGVIAGEFVTTSKTDAAGNVQTTFKYLNSVDTSSNVREYYYNNLRARFAQSRLTNGDIQPNRNMANQGVIQAFLDGIYNTLSGEDYVLVQAGNDAKKYFKANRIVSLNLQTGTVTINMKMPIVTQLRTILATMQISFSTT